MKPSAEDYEKAIDIVKVRMGGWEDVVVQEVVKVSRELAAARESAEQPAAVPVAELKEMVKRWRNFAYPEARQIVVNARAAELSDLVAKYERAK